MKIALIDDERPSRSELRYLITKIKADAEIIEASSGEDGLKLISQEKFDLILIDINLGDISGITLASTARKIQPEVEIVFATAYNSFAEDAFQVEALDYLLKPFSEKKVRAMLEKYARKHLNRESLDNKISKIPLNVDKKIILVDINSIIYIESQNKNCIVYTKNDKYMDSTPLKTFEERLKSSGFFRIHKSYLVNIKYISEIFPWFKNSFCVKMQYYEDNYLPISRNKIKELKNLLRI